MGGEEGSGRVFNESLGSPQRRSLREVKWSVPVARPGWRDA